MKKLLTVVSLLFFGFTFQIQEAFTQTVCKKPITHSEVDCELKLHPSNPNRYILSCTMNSPYTNLKKPIPYKNSQRTFEHIPTSSELSTIFTEFCYNDERCAKNFKCTKDGCPRGAYRCTEEACCPV